MNDVAEPWPDARGDLPHRHRATSGPRAIPWRSVVAR
jgi:hypothetical protein